MLCGMPSGSFVHSFFCGGGAPCCTARGTLIPQPGIELVPLAVKAWSPNHWTTRVFPRPFYKDCLPKVQDGDQDAALTIPI